MQEEFTMTKDFIDKYNIHVVENINDVKETDKLLVFELRTTVYGFNADQLRHGTVMGGKKGIPTKLYESLNKKIVLSTGLSSHSHYGLSLPSTHTYGTLKIVELDKDVLDTMKKENAPGPFYIRRNKENKMNDTTYEPPTFIKPCETCKFAKADAYDPHDNQLRCTHDPLPKELNEYGEVHAYGTCGYWEADL